MHAMFVLCIGKTQKKAVVIDNEVKIRDMMNTVWTIDHRFGDAVIGMNLIRIVRSFTEDPESFNLDSFPDYTVYKPRPIKVD